MKTNTQLLKNTQKYRKTKKGVLTNMFNHMKKRHPIEFSLIDFQDRFLEDKKFNRLYTEWIKSNFQKQLKPSLDRINNKKEYTIKNTQMLNWAENRYKQSMEGRNRNGAVIQMIGSKVINIFKSQREAVVRTGISQSNMSSVLNGKRKTVNGYNFIYQNPELLK